MHKDKYSILPINDIEEHTKSELCKCKPKIEELADKWLIIHNSFDRREDFEKGKAGHC